MQPSRVKAPDLLDLNQLILSGQVASRLRIYADGKLVFTLENEWGRFYVQWVTPNWQPLKGSRVMVRGSVFSAMCKCGRSHTARVHADDVILLNDNGQ